jgi:predicted permease
MLDSLRQDMLGAVRAFVRSPASTFPSMLMLVLGAALNTVMFSLVHAALVRPLPFRDSDRLVTVWEVHSERGQTVLTPGNFLQLREDNEVFEHMTGSIGGPLELTGAGEPQLVAALFVLPDFFSVFHVEAAHGRALSSGDFDVSWDPSEGLYGIGHVVVLSDGYWRRNFGGAPAVVGAEVRLGGKTVRVVGVMPPNLDAVFPESDLFVPWILPPDAAQVRTPHEIPTYARLKSGVTLETAASAVATIYGRFEQDHPDSNAGWDARILPLREVMYGRSRLGLLTLLGGAALVLLAACFNAANLLLARCAVRRSEIAVRRALGASPWRIFRQLLTEGLFLALAAGVVALALSPVVMQSASRLLRTTTAPFPLEPRLDWTMFFFTLGIALFAGVVLGISPALRGARAESGVAIRAGASIGRSDGNRTRSVLLAFQVALSMVLLTVGGLLFQSLLRLRATDPGFDPDRLITMKVSLPRERYVSPRSQQEFRQQLLEEVRSVPGVVDAWTSTALPFTRPDLNLTFAIEGRPSARDDFSASAVLVSEGFLHGLGASTVQGRGITAADRPDVPWVVVINETMARRFWPGENAVGKRIRFLYDWMDDQWVAVVGVVPDIPYNAPGMPSEPVLYLPHDQLGRVMDLFLVVRPATSSLDVLAPIQERVHALDPLLPVAQVRTMQEVESAFFGAPRMRALLIGIYAFLALTLVVGGLYAMMARAVAERTRELGLRRALGATEEQILRMVLGRGMKVATVGLLAGGALALGVSRWVASLLFGVPPHDSTTYGLTGVLLAAVAYLACYVPARRAAGINPVEALKYE